MNIYNAGQYDESLGLRTGSKYKNLTKKQKEKQAKKEQEKQNLNNMKIFNNKNIIQKIPEVEEPMQYNE